MPSTLHQRTALITGASSGLGADFARVLAQLECDLILVARSEQPMLELQQEIQAKHHIDITIIALDLTTPNACESLYEQVKDAAKSIDILINNAGFGIYGEFAESSWEKQEEMLLLNMDVPIQLTKLFLPEMIKKKSGYILFVSSIGAYQPTPLYATYSATKSFILSFGEALNFELRDTGVNCTVLSPGVTATHFLATAGQAPTLYQKTFMMKSEDVVRIGIDALLKNRPSVVAGWKNKLMTWFVRFIPRRWAAWMAYQSMKQS